jgi:dethiobiotin synthetase
MRKSIFVAATGQHVGKTTSTLGLVANFKEMGINVGYCKPVGQQHVTYDGMLADKDAVLFAEMLNFKLDPVLHSPVILGDGVTAEYIDNPGKFDFHGSLEYASSELARLHDLVVYEGTGHPGVGSVVNLSNADAARQLNASVIMIAEGGIGSTIDRMAMSLALFREQKVPIIGVIINKVLPEKLEKIQDYLGRRLADMGLPLLGVLPYDKSLSFPIMETVKQVVRGHVAFNEDKLGNRVEEIVSGSLIGTEELKSFQNVLLVVSHKRLEEAIGKIKWIAAARGETECPLSGVIVTGDGRHEFPLDDSGASVDYFRDNEIPVLTTALDTLGSVIKISRIEVKINTRTPWKVQRAIELIKEHVALHTLLGVNK